MKAELVHTIKKEIFTTSKILSDLLEVDHSDLLRTIKSILKRKEKQSAGQRTVIYPQKFIETTFKNKMGREYTCYNLNEQAYLKLAMQLSGYEKAEIVQDSIIEAFSKMKAALLNKDNAVFKQNREQGKIARSSETDAIQLLTEYAENERGKPISYPLYSTYTQMTNKNIRFLMDTKEGRPLRDLATIEQLGFISVVDSRAERCIRDGLDRRLPYKEIYKYAKKEIELLVDSLGFKKIEDSKQ